MPIGTGPWLGNRGTIVVELLAGQSLAQRARVCRVRGADLAARRLMEMGFVEGAVVEVIGLAPLGDPMRVRLGDSMLSIRRCDAARVEVRRAG